MFDFGTPLGILIGFGALAASVIIDGGSLTSLVNLSGAIIIFGGLTGAMIVTNPFQRLMRLPGILRVLLFHRSVQPIEVIDLFQRIANQVQQAGGNFQILDQFAEAVMDPYLRRGLLLLADATGDFDSNDLVEILRADTEKMIARHQEGIGMFSALGGYAPTMGIIGTVMGLVHVLANLNDPSSLGESIATAFIATLYGVSTANLIFLPIASRLTAIHEQEVFTRELIMHGLLCIWDHLPGMKVRQRLEVLLAEYERKKVSERSGRREAAAAE
jgi:chemotaxis protein MotA